MVVEKCEVLMDVIILPNPEESAQDMVVERNSINLTNILSE